LVILFVSRVRLDSCVLGGVKGQKMVATEEPTLVTTPVKAGRSPCSPTSPDANHAGIVTNIESFVVSTVPLVLEVGALAHGHARRGAGDHDKASSGRNYG